MLCIQLNHKRLSVNFYEMLKYLRNFKRHSHVVLRCTFVIGLILIINFSFCQQHSLNSLGARQNALANTSVCLISPWSVFCNPAGINKPDNLVIGFNYYNKYLIEELNTNSLIVTIPLLKGNFGAGISLFGSSLYNEQRYSFAYAHQLGDKLSAGISGNYYLINLPEEYRGVNHLSGNIGALIYPSEKLTFGFNISNLGKNKLSYYSNENIPLTYKTGISWSEEIFMLCTQVEFTSDGSTSISTATEINFGENLDLRAGISNKESFNFSIGLGYLLKNIQGNIAFLRHPVLGITSSFDLIFNIKN